MYIIIFHHMSPWLTHQILLICPQCRIYASVNWVSIDSCNGLSPVRRQAITQTNADILFDGPLEINSSEIQMEIQKLVMRNGGHFFQEKISQGDCIALFHIRQLTTPCNISRVKSLTHERCVVVILLSEQMLRIKFMSITKLIPPDTLKD